MDIKQETINSLRILSAEQIQKANSGHPGLPFGSAPIVYELYQNFLNCNPQNTKWDNRDRFVLSAGHGSALLYSLLYLYGFCLTKEDLMGFRKFGSKTPGHPEYRHTIGVETTTGPLGQGIAMAVGMALAEKHLSSKFNRKNYNIVDHYTYVLCGDGCLEEGISYEACSFAGANELGKLILFYDDNDITIEGNTDITFKEDVGKRFVAQDWDVHNVDFVNNPDKTELLAEELQKAKNNKTHPSIIIVKTKIGYGTPLEGNAKCHGSPLGEENLEKTKKILGWTEKEAFTIPQEVLKYCQEFVSRGEKAEKDWEELFLSYEKEYPVLAEEYKQAMQGYLPDLENDKELFEFEKPLATRQTSHITLNRIARKIPYLMGGSADLAPSNLSNMKDTATTIYGDFSTQTPQGRNIHFGIREHAMVAISNGMQLHGGLRAYCSTFFIFSDYCKHAMRLSALMNLPVIYILTHDSIGVGEDGPTHEPIEQLIALRSIPRLKVYRPADGKETACAWISALKGNEPTAIVLTRQALPQYQNSGLNALKGGYVLDDCNENPEVLLISSGSEVELCVKAKIELEKENIKARVISMPCFEEFEKQPESYKQQVLPKNIKARVCVEAGSPYSWYKYSGNKGKIIAMQDFGASGKAEILFEKFGFTVENVVNSAKESIKDSLQD